MPFNIHVALSRSAGRKGIRLLHDLMKSFSLGILVKIFLRAEDERLARNEETENGWKGFRVPNFA